MLDRHKATPARSRSNLLREAWASEDISRNASEPVSASLRVSRVANLPEMVKPVPVVKHRAFAAMGLSGVVGDGGCRQICQEPGRPAWTVSQHQRDVGIHNHLAVQVGSRRGS